MFFLNIFACRICWCAQQKAQHDLLESVHHTSVISCECYLVYIAHVLESNSQVLFETQKNTSATVNLGVSCTMQTYISAYIHTYR